MRKLSEEHIEKIRQSHLARKADVMEEICEMAKKGHTVKEIAEKFDKTASSINKALRRRNIKASRGLSPKKGISTTPEKVAEICEMAKQGKTAKEIAKYFNDKEGKHHSPGHIYKILAKNNIEIPRNYSCNTQKLHDICEMYCKGMTVTEISKHFGFAGTGYVSRILINHGLRTHASKRTDGYHLDSQGYLWVRVADDDPMVCMRTKRGTISEHRLNLARKLGRPLEKYESVHHIDGIKTNNHPDNLELRVGRHGRGQKMECAECTSNNLISLEYLKCGDCGSNKIRFCSLD